MFDKISSVLTEPVLVRLYAIATLRRYCGALEWNRGPGMRLLFGLAGLGFLTAGLYASDAFASGTVYDKPFHQAYADLSTMPIMPLLGQSGASTVEQRVVRTTVTRNPDSIGWTLAIGPDEVATFTARLAPVGESRTRVVLGIRRAATEMAAARPDVSSNLIVEFARIVMTEQVDARLENRAPDTRAIALATSRYIASSPKNLRDFGEGSSKAMIGVAAHLNRDAIGRERWTPPQTTQDATRPSVTFSSE